MITVIPAINCKKLDCVKEAIQKISVLASSWIQVDISDGIFTPITTFNDPEEFKKLLKSFYILSNIEVHLMVNKPLEYIDKWLEIGSKRIIVHIESIKDNDEFNLLVGECRKFNAELGLAIRPETEMNGSREFFEKTKFIQVLAVQPGFSGQEILPNIIEKIKILRERYKYSIIEIDGGINAETAHLVKSVGVDVLVSASYILNSENPIDRYKILSEI